MLRVRSHHARRRGAALVFVVSLAAVALGCGGSQAEPPPPFEMGGAMVVKEGDPSKQHKAPFTIAITSPAKGEKFKRGETVEVTCTLTVPPDGAMPGTIFIDVFDRKNRIVGGGDFAPKSDLGDGRYTLVHSIKLPDQTGVYKLLATAHDRVVLGSDAPPNPTINRTSTRITISDPLEVRAQ